MVATLSVMYDWGGSDGSPGNSTTIDALGPPNLRFKTYDSSTIDTLYPIPIVSGQTKYSYWKQIYLKCVNAPATQIDNIKFYSDGSGFGTGITLSVGLQMPTKNSGSSAGYQVADGTAGDSGTAMVGGHSSISSKASVFSYTSVSPLACSISEAGNVINAVNETTSYLVLQMEVIDTATAGGLTAETLTFQYDES